MVIQRPLLVGGRDEQSPESKLLDVLPLGKRPAPLAGQTVAPGAGAPSTLTPSRMDLAYIAAHADAPPGGGTIIDPEMVQKGRSMLGPPTAADSLAPEAVADDETPPAP